MDKENKRRFIKEGKVRKGGLKPIPASEKPKIKPSGQKPISGSDCGREKQDRQLDG